MAQENEEVSVEERIGEFMFGADPEPEPEAVEAADESDEPVEEATEEPEETEDSGLVEFEFEGQLYEGPPSLKDALLRNADYTQKTQAVSAKEKEVAAREAQIEAVRREQEFIGSVGEDIKKIDQIDYMIPQYRAYLKQHVEGMTASQIETVRLAIEDLTEQRTQIVQSLQGKQREFQQAREQSVKELLDKSTEVLKSKVPNWSKVEADVTAYVSGLGFTEQQVQVAKTDPRQMLLAHKAMLYDKLQDGKTAAVAKVQANPKIAPKSRSKPMPEDTKRMLNARKNLNSKNPIKRQQASEEMVMAKIGRIMN